MDLKKTLNDFLNATKEEASLEEAFLQEFFFKSEFLTLPKEQVDILEKITFDLDETKYNQEFLDEYAEPTPHDDYRYSLETMNISFNYLGEKYDMKITHSFDYETEETYSLEINKLEKSLDLEKALDKQVQAQNAKKLTI